MHQSREMTRRHVYAVRLLVPSYQAGLNFYVGILGLSVVEGHWVGADKR